MIKELIIVRHGEAESLMGKDLTGGWTNSTLTQKGKRQARVVGEKLAEILKKEALTFFAATWIGLGRPQR